MTAMTTMTMEERETLAAEYVLGTLLGEARRTFEAELAESTELRREVEAWERRINPLAEMAPEVRPPEALWHALEGRLWPEARPAPWWRRAWESVALWRGLGLAATAALLLALTLVMQPSAPPGAPFEAVAIMETPDGQADWVLTANPDDGRMRLRAVHHQHIGTDDQCRLYLAKNGGYRAVTVMPEVGERTVTLDRELIRALLGQRLVISIEPTQAPFVAPTNPTPLKSRWVTF